MQHTETYNLNIIETSDTFSPEALNENAQKLEDALVTHEAVVDTALKAQKLEWQAADSALDGKLSALDTAKAEKTALSAETAAREAAQAALTALTGRVGALEDDRLVYKLDSYSGTGYWGEAYPNRLEFDFKPLMVVIAIDNAGSYVWMRGQKIGRIWSTSLNNQTAQLTWGNKALQWYTNDAMYQLNIRDFTYYYFVLGVRE